MNSARTNAVWLARFAARLLVMKPELDVVEAVRITKREYEKAFRVDPAEAAEIFVKASAANH